MEHTLALAGIGKLLGLSVRGGAKAVMSQTDMDRGDENKTTHTLPRAHWLWRSISFLETTEPSLDLSFIRNPELDADVVSAFSKWVCQFWVVVYNR